MVDVMVLYTVETVDPVWIIWLPPEVTVCVIGQVVRYVDMYLVVRTSCVPDGDPVREELPRPFPWSVFVGKELIKEEFSMPIPCPELIGENAAEDRLSAPFTLPEFTGEELLVAPDGYDTGVTNTNW